MSIDNTSSGQGVTPTLDQSVMDTSASGAMPQKPSLTLEEALQRIADLEHVNKNATEERDRHRKKLSSYEEAERKAQEASLSEIERAKKQYSDLQQEHETYRRQTQEKMVRYEVQAVARSLGIIDEDAASKLLDWTELEFSDDGLPTNAEKLLKELLKKKPYLAGTPAAETKPANAPSTPALPAMNPGRTHIATPGAVPPGKIPRLSDVYRRS